MHDGALHTQIITGLESDLDANKTIIASVLSEATHHRFNGKGTVILSDKFEVSSFFAAVDHVDVSDVCTRRRHGAKYAAAVKKQLGARCKRINRNLYPVIFAKHCDCICEIPFFC